MVMASLNFATRFQGPPRSANGGYVAGSLIDAVFGTDDATYTVRLSRPPALETDLDVVEADGVAELRDPDGLVARALRDDRELEPVTPVDLRLAGRAESSFPGLLSHPFPACFGCGTGADQGLRVHPGEVEAAVEGRRRVATAWVATPQHPLRDVDGEGDELSLATTWAAIDCAGGWAAHIEKMPIVLGQMTGRVLRLPRVDQRHVIVAEERSREGRRINTATSLYDGDGGLMATAEQVWITIDPEQFT